MGVYVGGGWVKDENKNKPQPSLEYSKTEMQQFLPDLVLKTWTQLPTISEFLK